MSVLFFFIPIVSTVFLVFFLFFNGEDVKYIIGSKDSGKTNDKNGKLYPKIKDLDEKKVEFLYESSRQSMNDTFQLRDGENKTILSHATIFAAVCTLFWIVGRWTYQNHDKIGLFVVLSILLFVVFVFLVTSISAVFSAFNVKYTLPPQSKDLVNLSNGYDEIELKKMLIDRWTGCTTMNYTSNERKMNLLTISRKHLFFALVVLVFSLSIIVVQKYLEIIAPSL